jgi:nucleoside-diphosphate-sugar epimerase
MTILITGANGFVGGNVSRYLTAQGLKCLALDIAGAPEQGGYAARYTWDKLDAIPWCEVGAVIHLAGKAHDTKSTSDPQSYFDINVGLTKKILEEFANARMRECANGGETPRQGEADPSQFAHSRIRALKFIFFSSVKACADTVEGVLTEDAQPMPQTPYGKSKLEAEKEVLKFESAKVLKLVNIEHRTSNIEHPTGETCSYFRTYILRPAMIHGPGNKGNLNLLVKVVQKGIPWPLGAFENQRSFTSIENVSRVLEALITTDVAPGTYQVADDEPLSTNQVIGLIAESLGRTPRIWKIAPGFMRCVARIGDILHLPLNSERLKKLTESYVVSNRKLLRALGWQKMPVSAPEGMRATLIATTKWSQ